jgi:thiol-disulfide isomerase/thioredoxin
MPGQPGSTRSWSQRAAALLGLVIIVGSAVGVLALAGVIGGSGGGTTEAGIPIQNVEFLDPPRALGQEDLDVGAGVGQLAPDFEISDFDGSRHKLSDFRGEVVYVNFWATWCQPCIAELPEIQELLDRNPGTLSVITVNRRQGLGEAEDWLGKLQSTDGTDGLSFTVDGLDPDDRLYERLVRLKPAMPVSIFINSEGVVTSVANGAIRLPQMEQAVAEARASTSTALLP